ncbi:MAG: hypothetical protein ACJ74U_19565 [Jatrophihabitantaceae bacterium]
MNLSLASRVRTAISRSDYYLTAYCYDGGRDSVRTRLVGNRIADRCGLDHGRGAASHCLARCQQPLPIDAPVSFTRAADASAGTIEPGGATRRRPPRLVRLAPPRRG